MADEHARAAMFTVCPKCALTLVVTAADLRVAQGYVRCGRCSSVFNALARLSDERQLAGADGEPAVEPAPEPATPAQEEHADLSPLDEALARSDDGATPEASGIPEEPVSDEALEFDPETTDVRAVFVEPPPNPQWTAATGSFKAMRAASKEATPEPPTASSSAGSQVDVEIDAAFLAEMLREAAPAAPESSRSEPPPQQRAPPPGEPPASPPRQPPPRTLRDSAPESDAAPAAAVTGRAALPGEGPRSAARHATQHTRPPVEASVRTRAAATPAPAPPPREERTFAAPDEDTSDALDLDGEEMSGPRDDAAERRWLPLERLQQVWAAGAIFALLLLLAQIVNHYRDELAASPRFNRPLTAFYASFGVRLVPHWDLRAYDVRQLGASADPAGSGLITVRASIKNSGREPQPLPLLRVTLQDRFGNRIAARDVAPRFYVPPTMPESSYLAGGQRIDAEMGFVDPGANAVGFEIDACLPTSAGEITCANDLATR